MFLHRDYTLTVPRESIGHLWEAFHDIAEGFGLQLDELQEICGVLEGDMRIELDDVYSKAEVRMEFLASYALYIHLSNTHIHLCLF